MKESTTENKRPKKTEGKSKTPLQPGDPNYKTPTQLHNARKRRSKQKKRRLEEAASKEASGPGGPKRPRVSSEKATTPERGDPSMEFFEDPFQAPVVKEARDLFGSISNLEKKPFEVYMGPKTKWRTHAKLSVRPNSTGCLCMGLFAPKSHLLVPNSRTSPLHHPRLNRTMTILERLARQHKVPAFAETKAPLSSYSSSSSTSDPRSTNAAPASLKYVIASVERATSNIQLTLVWQERPDSDNKPLEDLCQALVEESNTENPHSFILHSLWVHYHPATFSTHQNAIYAIEGGRWETKHGPSIGTRETLQLHLKRDKAVDSETKTDTEDDAQVKQDTEDMSKPKITKPDLYFPPTVFRQANIAAFGKIVGQIRTYLQQQAVALEKKKIHLLELYGGVGTIGLHMVDLCSSLTCSDENPNNQACFQRAVESLASSGHRCKIRYIPKNASDMVQSESRQLKKADWIIVDPPRKGLETEVCNTLCSNGINASVLVYVSCGFAAFSRDYQYLVEKQWELVQACGHILFPGSNAIETLAIFRRKAHG